MEIKAGVRGAIKEFPYQLYYWSCLESCYTVQYFSFEYQKTGMSQSVSSISAYLWRFQICIEEDRRTCFWQGGPLCACLANLEAKNLLYVEWDKN